MNTFTSCSPGNIATILSFAENTEINLTSVGTIISATYGTPGTFADVTALVNSFVHANNRTLYFTVSNSSMGGDPCPNVVKTLTIQYTAWWGGTAPDRVVKGFHNVRITGATGIAAGVINGVYEPTETMNDNATVYFKEGDASICLEYYRAASIMQWQVKRTTDNGTYRAWTFCGVLSRCLRTTVKDTDRAWAFCGVLARCLPQECPAGQWYVYDGSNWGTQSSVTISFASTAADRVMKGNHNIRTTGATGTAAGFVNGMFKPMEVCDSVML